MYGSGGKNSRVLVKKYSDAVIELADKFAYLKAELEDPTNWGSIKDDEEKKVLFKKAFTKAATQLGKVKQYYEFSWEDESFGMTQHTWLQYIGAYKNLFPKEPEPTGIIIDNIVGKTKIQGTQVIDAQSIFTLIDKQTSSKDGVLVINDNNLILILEQIQELSNLGENELAESLKTFISEELVPGHLSADTDVDTAFNAWQAQRQMNLLEEFASEWGLDSQLLAKSLKAYDLKKPDEVPFREDIVKTLDATKATNQFSGSKLKLNMELNKVLPSWMQEVKMKFR